MYFVCYISRRVLQSNTVIDTGNGAYGKEHSAFLHRPPNTKRPKLLRKSASNVAFDAALVFAAENTEEAALTPVVIPGDAHKR